MTVWTAILVCVLATSILSGVIGMAGGLVLMGVLVTLLPVSAAMIVHGAVQATSNGARWLFLRRHMRWEIVPPYVAGAVLVLGGFAALTLVPEPGVVLMLIGAFPWLARAMPAGLVLDVQRPVTAFSCGFVVTAAQLCAGASGPLLDAFFLNSPLNRYEVVASKAFTQTLGHLAKIGYYGVVVGAAVDTDVDGPAWLIAVACLIAVLGARIGTRLLGRLDEDRFRRISGYVILALGAFCFAKGILDTFGN
ncbi:MAG: sulfite exporter TauE/SafE family protein [Gammaproteobacteria bacterium]|nr:sulfite exporter TauE/SafE family protein [Gammaproteobacteria bacterium]